MKKRILVLLAVVATLVSCDSVQQSLKSTYNMINCEYNYKSISGLTVSGIDLSSGLSLTAIPKITSILSGSATSIPLNFNLNLDVKNPNESAAMLHGLQYILSIDGIEFTTGSINQSLNIGAGQTQTLPLSIGVDLASLMKNNSKDAVVDIAKNFLGIGSEKSEVSLQLKPSFNIGGTTVASPVYIPVSFSFGGTK
ncbi:LEA14-like dessication related protein [Dysgonomonas hofstadii]|uniref:LEA14-like dessication related protein n=1 Tax=Dysgonomonas hofstadii TaxID=637886 RepID=A0A840CLP8_9BACT|nr:LEA type 2 family protein [Dysgonomonas hofstadii]MBB4036296.1 LEA14-like dessication related protein [Dysgonomonas hofstadii]